MKKKFLVLVTLLLFVLTGCSKKEKEHDYSQDIDPYSTIFFQDMKYESEDYIVDEKDNLSYEKKTSDDSKIKYDDNKEYYKKRSDGTYTKVSNEEDFEIYEIYTITTTSSGVITYETVTSSSSSSGNSSSISQNSSSSSSSSGSSSSSTPSSSSQSGNSNPSAGSSSGSSISPGSTTPAKKSNLVSYNGWLKLSGTNIVNNKGEKFQLRGMSSHGLQWYGNLVTEQNIKVLRDEWGSNVFRLAMYTSEGGYLDNRSIYNVLEKDIDMLIKNDMYVIVDWHILNDNNPSSHTNEAIEFFNKVSSKYGNTPNIIYEICNEPHWVSWDNDIKPYADKVIATIRKNSPNSLIIVGTNTWSQDVLDPINNRINDKNVLYALHFYSGTHTSWLRDRADQALAAGIPIFVSEWGTSSADGNGGVFLDEAQKWVDWMKKNNISWASWSLSDKNESSAVLKPGSSIINDNNLTTSGNFVKKAIKG